MSTSNSIEVLGLGGALRETATPKLLQDTDARPRTEALATRLLSNQKYYINSKVRIKIAGFNSKPPGKLHTWKSRLFSELF